MSPKPYWAMRQNIAVQETLQRVPIFISANARRELHTALTSVQGLHGIGYSEFIEKAVQSEFWNKGVTMEMVEQDINDE